MMHRPRRAVAWLAWVVLAGAAIGASRAGAQTTTPAPASPTLPGAPASPDQGSGPRTGVVRPPANVDPGMTRRTPPAAAFPTPVLKPPTVRGDTVIVPK